jgi:hypothetical protein
MIAAPLSSAHLKTLTRLTKDSSLTVALSLSDKYTAQVNDGLDDELFNVSFVLLYVILFLGL